MLKKLSLIQELDTEVNEMEARFRQGLASWWEDLLPYMIRLREDFTWNLLPPLVLAVYKFAGVNRQLGISMANVFKTLYLANFVYSSVKDEEEGQDHDQEMQFSILIADYLFGHVLKQLVLADASHLLKHFADMVAEINEGLVMEHKLGVNSRQAMMKTRAPLYKTTFATAAELAGLDGDRKSIYQDLGFNYGMAVELLHHNRFYDEAEAYYNQSRLLMRRLNANNPVQNSLEKALIELHLFSCDIEKAAVV